MAHVPFTTLLSALRAKDLALVQQLVKNSDMVAHTNSALHWAAAGGCVQTVRFLLEKRPANAHIDQVPLMVAVLKSNQQIFDALHHTFDPQTFDSECKSFIGWTSSEREQIKENLPVMLAHTQWAKISAHLEDAPAVLKVRKI